MQTPLYSVHQKSNSGAC